ncbi:MAG: shikimate kinase [Bacteroidales bacterium]|nr:shikimate kinase [Bacteroidales bacterium]
MNIYLIGFMGSGKSYAGKRIANLLHWKFIDTDRLIEKKKGMTVTEIFAARGEEYFRRVEAAILREVVKRHRMVVACGGGMPCYGENLALMKSAGVTVWLKLSPETLVSRLMHSKADRPLLHGAGPAELRSLIVQMLDTRNHWYEQADLIIDAEAVGEEEMAALITETIRTG